MGDDADSKGKPEGTESTSTTKKSQTFKMAFLLDADSLRRLSDLLKENVLDQIEVPKRAYVTEDNEVAYKPLYEKRINYSVDFSDDSSFETPSIEEVLNLPNSNRRRITSVSLSTPFMASKIRAEVRLRDSRYGSVSYDLRGEDKEVLSLADKLEDRLPGLRQWYSPLARISFVAAAVVTYIVVFALASALVAADFFLLNFLQDNPEPLNNG